MIKTILKKTSITGYIATLCMATPAYAALPLTTDDTGTVGMMKVQFETSGEFGWDRERSNGTTIRTDGQQFTEVITAGVADPLDLIVTVPFSWQQVTGYGQKIYDNDGLNDLTLAVKWRFLELGPASFAVKPAVIFPTGDHNRGLGAARPAYAATLISSIEFKPVAIHANVGYTRQDLTSADKDSNRQDLWNLSLAGTVEVMNGLQVAAEIGTASNRIKADTTWPAYLTVGIIYSVIDNLDLSLGVKCGLTAPETDLALITGITYKFP
jgi:hypothetical protein